VCCQFVLEYSCFPNKPLWSFCGYGSGVTHVPPLGAAWRLNVSKTLHILFLFPVRHQCKFLTTTQDDSLLMSPPRYQILITSLFPPSRFFWFDVSRLTFMSNCLNSLLVLFIFVQYFPTNPPIFLRFFITCEKSHDRFPHLPRPTKEGCALTPPGHSDWLLAAPPWSLAPFPQSLTIARIGPYFLSWHTRSLTSLISMVFLALSPRDACVFRFPVPHPFVDRLSSPLSFHCFM